MKITFFIITFIFVNECCLAQNLGFCGSYDIGVNNKISNCNNESESWNEKYRISSFWQANDNVPIKTILVNWIVCQKDDGSNAWQDIPQFRNQVQLMFDRINDIYSNVQEKGYDLICEPEINYITDTKIRFELNDIIFIKNDLFNSSNSGFSIMTWLHNNFPETKYALNHIFTMPPPQGGTWGYYSYNLLDEYSFIHTYFSMYSDWYVVWDDHVNHIAHEYAHSVGLHHTYDSEILNMNHYEYLNDVFGECGQNSCCNPSPDYSCYLTNDCFWNTASFPFNIMSGSANSRYISPKQSGRMHRSLSLYDNNFVVNNIFMHKYVKEITPYVNPMEIIQNEIWDFKIKLYQNLIIKTGNTLTIKCEVMMPNNGKIIIEPGASLIIDGGKITNYYFLEDERKDFWEGIEIWGNSAQTQTQGHQGTLIMKNGAILENAHEAIQVWKPDDWASTGGIINATNSYFKNNWRSIAFLYYHSLNNNNIEIKNKGYIADCEFTWDDNFFRNDANCGISMYHVNGVRIYRSKFIDNRTNVSTWTNRPVGIGSIDAGYSVLGRYASPTLPQNQTQDAYFNPNLPYCEFKNLEIGIDASNATSSFPFLVDNSQFENCGFGIYLSSHWNATVIRNKFEANNNKPSAMPYMKQLNFNWCSGYKVEGNVFNNSTFGALGCLVYNSQHEPNQIYR
ncbi:MAG: hypothetical protein HYU67_05810, partial [Flavobacteriia bacterium]|nr:hypothetical protein [Flavobacteriia bacterium]